jgi:beta-barrel assembly-enhancing protease
MMGNGGGMGIKAIIGLVMAIIAVGGYFMSGQRNPVTGEVQRVSLDPKEEIALGLRTAPQLIAQYGGESDDPRARQLVESIGNRIVAKSDASKGPYQFEFHLLDDDRTINAFALPGGQVFVTTALAKRLRTRGELAGTLGHEVGHVIGRHGAEQLAKQQLTQGLIGAVAVGSDNSQNAVLAQAIGSLLNMKYGRDDELESDRFGVRFMAQAGYDPRALIGVMEVLSKAGGGGRTPEFFSTHPNPENRIQRIKEAIKAEFPNGVPAGLEK